MSPIEEALSRYLLSIVMIPFIVALKIGQNEPNAIIKIDARLKLVNMCSAYGVRSVAGNGLIALKIGFRVRWTFLLRPIGIPNRIPRPAAQISDGIKREKELIRFNPISEAYFGTSPMSV